MFLCDYRNIYGEASTRSAVRSKLGELLGKLNLRQDVLTGQLFHGQTDESLGRTKVEFESILNTILNSKGDISTFFIENSDGSVNKDFTFKQWIDFVSKRIKDSDISKIKDAGVKKILSRAQTELNKITDLEMSDSEYFDTDGMYSELKRGMRIFEIILDVIGHSTFRFIVSHGISHNDEVRNIFIGLMDAHGKSILAEYCNQFTFYPSTVSTRGVGGYQMSARAFSEHQFSLFFGDAVIYFATKDVKGREIRSSKNAYYLGNSPVSFLEEGYKVTNSILRDLQSAFLKSYSQYVSRIKKSSVSTKSQMFLDSNSFDIIARSIETTLEKVSYGTKAERLKDIRRAELHLRIGLGDPDTGDMSTIRYYLEKAVTESKRHLDLLINGIRVVVPATRLANIPVYGNLLGISYENQHIANKRAIDNRVEIFKDAIKNNKELNGKARFFITLDSDQIGIQYFKITSSDTLSKYFKAHGVSSAVYVDVDINNDPNKLLEKLARISMTYQQGPGNLRFGLIMKSVSSNINDPAYFVLNGDHFLAEDEIFSKEKTSTSNHQRFYIPLTGDSSITFTGNFDIEEINNRVDKRYFIYNLYLKFVKNLEWFV